jgi:hypothetical protein
MSNLKGGKSLFWLTILEVSVHSHLVMLLWFCGEVEHHSGEHVLEQSYSH